MKADIFFFVTTIAVAVISVLIVIGLVYVIAILKITKDFSKKVKEEGEATLEDLKEFRAKIKITKGIGKLPVIFGFIKKLSEIGKSKRK